MYAPISAIRKRLGSCNQVDAKPESIIAPPAEKDLMTQPFPDARLLDALEDERTATGPCAGVLLGELAGPPVRVHS